MASPSVTSLTMEATVETTASSTPPGAEQQKQQQQKEQHDAAAESTSATFSVNKTIFMAGIRTPRPDAELSVADALAFLSRVQAELGTDAEGQACWADVLDILNSIHKSPDPDIPQLYNRMAQVLRPHPELLSGFRMFLPAGEVDENGSAATPSDEDHAGALTRQHMRGGLSQLGRTSDGLSLVYRALTAQRLEVTSLEVLREYPHLQRVDLSHNRIVCVRVLSALQSLVELDVSHNELTCLLDFRPIPSLRIVNYSHNKLSDLGRVQEHKFLRELRVNGNAISSLRGLAGMQFIERLCVDDNNLSSLDGVQDLPLLDLQASGNQLVEFPHVLELSFLTRLALARNQLTSLASFGTDAACNPALHHVDVSDNHLTDSDQLDWLRTLPLLAELRVCGNQIDDHPSYRLLTAFKLPDLSVLDDEPLSAEEKVAAINKYDPPQQALRRIRL